MGLLSPSLDDQSKFPTGQFTMLLYLILIPILNLALAYWLSILTIQEFLVSTLQGILKDLKVLTLTLYQLLPQLLLCLYSVTTLKLGVQAVQLLISRKRL